MCTQGTSCTYILKTANDNPLSRDDVASDGTPHARVIITRHAVLVVSPAFGFSLRCTAYVCVYCIKYNNIDEETTRDRMTETIKDYRMIGSPPARKEAVAPL